MNTKWVSATAVSSAFIFLALFDAGKTARWVCFHQASLEMGHNQQNVASPKESALANDDMLKSMNR